MPYNTLTKLPPGPLPVQDVLPFPTDGGLSNGVANKMAPSDRAVHDWYRFVLSFPPHLVREYTGRFGLQPGQTLLDPFCGTGTTLVESKLMGIDSIGIEANPMAHFASSVKTDWKTDPARLLQHSFRIMTLASPLLESASLRTLPEDSHKLLLTDSIAPRVLHKLLLLREAIDNRGDDECVRHSRLALAKTAVSCSNLHFGPEVGVSRLRKTDAPVLETWLGEMERIAQDLRHVGDCEATSQVVCADSRQLSNVLAPNSISGVFTSPPYPNEKDYTRTTRLESVLLGFARDRKELQLLKRNLLRSNTRNVYKGDGDDEWVAKFESIQAIAARIEARRVELGKTSGFERLYARVAKLYFGGMARHLSELRPFLKPGAFLGYVVGDQASYLQVMIRTGQILGEIAESLGYRVAGIDLFRTRLATATKQQMREEVVVLQWPGGGSL